jgi:hypothetical protein
LARCALGLLLLILASSATPYSLAQETNRTSRLDYSSFRIIADRNIFNATRSGRPARANRENARRAVQVESFALVGTLAYGDTKIAFFDGSSGSHRKALKLDGTIGPYRVTDIDVRGVTLERDGRPLEMRVGSQMRREDEGEWKLSARADLPAPDRRDSNADAPAAAASADRPTQTANAGEVSDVLKRLMQQREKELQ